MLFALPLRLLACFFEQHFLFFILVAAERLHPKGGLSGVENGGKVAVCLKAEIRHGAKRGTLSHPFAGLNGPDVDRTAGRARGEPLSIRREGRTSIVVV